MKYFELQIFCKSFGFLSGTTISYPHSIRKILKRRLQTETLLFETINCDRNETNINNCKINKEK